ncbi:hypothetical protein [Streptomyces hoynatensis]|uniref:Uncharacterized protein n=1 Tax=Streptomyces hoynatensis TaxID=1141874 RepID=A0A3A9Z595_9ACTN|nr:hypothetical protein [Streptomyces hoynatensis]RKN42447.1 hypothetical protein D7294_13650 [Streptomyces hoynatensis]
MGFAHIDWSALGQVALVSVLLTSALVGLFSVGMRSSASVTRAVRPVGYASFALCAAAVGYGVWIITG